MAIDNETLGAAIGVLAGMPDTAASSAAAAAESAEAAADSAAAAADAADSVTAATVEEMLEYLEVGEEQIDVERITRLTSQNPVIDGQANHMYICGEVQTIAIVPPAVGLIDVRFTSGTTAAVLTANGVTFPEWFDKDQLETERTYEISIMDGKYGSVQSWPETAT